MSDEELSRPMRKCTCWLGGGLGKEANIRLKIMMCVSSPGCVFILCSYQPSESEKVESKGLQEREKQ